MLDMEKALETQRKAALEVEEAIETNRKAGREIDMEEQEISEGRDRIERIIYQHFRYVLRPDWQALLIITTVTGTGRSSGMLDEQMDETGKGGSLVVIALCFRGLFDNAQFGSVRMRATGSTFLSQPPCLVG